MNNADIVFAHENYFSKALQPYTPADFHSLFDSFCLYLSQENLGLEHIINDIDEQYDRFCVSPQNTWFGGRPLEFSVRDVYTHSPYLQKKISEYVLQYVKNHIGEYEPEILANHIELLDYGFTNENDFSIALRQTRDLYYAAISSWVETTEVRHGTVYALSSLPSTDGNFLSAIKDASPEELSLALIRMSGKDGNKSRIAACEKCLRRLSRDKEDVPPKRRSKEPERE